MISLLVSEAYALDYLAILEVKADKSSTKENLKNKHITLDNLSEELGKRKLVNILQSPEYKKLSKVNEELFDLIQKLKTAPVEPALLDNYNYKRFLAKKELQDKFFKTKLSEQKIGYKE